jgi:hypothetical protein
MDLYFKTGHAHHESLITSSREGLGWQSNPSSGTTKSQNFSADLSCHKIGLYMPRVNT